MIFRLLNHDGAAIVDVHALRGGLALKLATLQVVPRASTFCGFCDFCVTDTRAEGLRNTADGADLIDKGVQLGLERRGAVLALLRVGVFGRRATPNVGMVMMVARLNADLRAVPAHVFTFDSISHTFGADHHLVANSQRTVVVAAVAGTDGPAAGLVQSGLGDDGAAGDDDLTTFFHNCSVVLCFLKYFGAKLQKNT